MKIKDRPPVDKIYEAGFREGWACMRKRVDEVLSLWIVDEDMEEHLETQLERLKKHYGDE